MRCRGYQKLYKWPELCDRIKKQSVLQGGQERMKCFQRECLERVNRAGK